MLDVGDTRLFAELRGPEHLPPLIVLHGGPGLDHHEFADYLDPLTATVRLVLLDMRAQGQSDRDAPQDTWTLEGMAADVSGVARALGAERYAVLGHSYGAFVALQQAVTQPGAAAATVVSCGVGSSRWLEDISARLERFEPPELREQVRRSWAEEEGVRSEGDFEGLMHEQMPWHFGDPRDPRIADYEERTAATVYAPDVLRAFSVAGYGGIEVEDRLSEITAPLLVLAGRLDRTCPPEASEVVAAGVEGARLHVFEESGHMPFVEQQGEYLAVVRKFLQEALGG